MKVLQHIVQQPFVAATALAALMHSTWSLGVAFAGEQPEAGLTIEFIGWLAPALLIAFALDIGLLSTSNDIRRGNRSIAKLATFGVLSLSMFYLQFLYISSHGVALPISEGISTDSLPLVIGLRNLAIWVIPALLPLSTLLYTFSQTEGTPVPDSQTESNTVAMSADTQTLAIVPIETPAIKPSKKNKHSVACPDCDWTGSYKSARAASSALNAHKRHCPGRISDDSQVGIGADGSATDTSIS
jgi:hypothetical protein